MVQANQPIPPTPERPPRVRLAKGQEVTLGCGTLILIAIIVAIFSNKSSVSVDISPVLSRLHEIDQKMQRMDQQLQKLEQKLDQLDKKVKP